MAIFRQGPILTAVSGSIGALTFANSPRSPYVKTHARLRKRASAQTQTARNNYTAAVRAWRNADQDNRDQWIAAALTTTFRNSIGVLRNISGYQLWMRIQLLRLTSSLAILDSPPQMTTSTPIPNPQLNATVPGGIGYSAAPFDPGGSTFRMFYGARAASIHVPAVFTYWRFLEAGFPLVGSTNLTTSWEAAFGALIEDDVVAVNAINFDADHLPALPAILSEAV